MMRRCAILLSVLSLLATLGWAAIAADISIPNLTGRVVDQAGILNSSDESRLTRKSQDLETKTSIQLVVVTLRSLQGHTIEEWGLALGRGWGIGQKGKDNGVLLIVAPNDRELRIEVGYGLEGTLPDATANAIIRNVIVPRFKAGNMAVGISDGADAIIKVLTGTGEQFAPSMPERASQLLSEWAPFLIVGIAILFMMIAHLFRDRDRDRRGRYYRNRRGGWLYVDDSDRNSSDWSSGGSSGGGGFSGGGGSFGGGGSSGRW